MACNICGVNDATIHLTEIINNQMIEIHLCETCSQEKGTDFKTHFNFGDILAGFTDFDKEISKGTKQEELKCPDCGTTYGTFTKKGRLGCPSCYMALSKLLLPLIKRVQKSMHHLGKKPSKVSKDIRTSHDLRLLQDRLRRCVSDEEFEEAAKIRDEIKQMQEKKEKKTKNG